MLRSQSSVTCSPATRRDKNESPATDWASGAENGYDSLNEEEPAPTIRPPSFIGRLEDMAADFQRKELIVEHDRGIRRSVKLSLRALLLASQATLAICTVSIHLLLYLWKVRIPSNSLLCSLPQSHAFIVYDQGWHCAMKMDRHLRLFCSSTLAVLDSETGTVPTWLSKTLQA